MRHRDERSRQWSNWIVVAETGEAGSLWIDRRRGFGDREIQLRIRSEDWSQDVQHRPGRDRADLHIVLQPNSGLRLRPRIAGLLEDTPIPLRWRLIARDDPESGSIPSRLRSPRLRNARSLDWTGIPPGRYDAVLLGMGHVLHRIEDLELEPGVLHEDTPLDRVDVREHCRIFPLILVTSDGRCLDGQRVQLRIRSENGRVRFEEQCMPCWLVAPPNEVLDVTVEVRRYRPASGLVGPSTALHLEATMPVRVRVFQPMLSERLLLRAELRPVGGSSLDFLEPWPPSAASLPELEELMQTPIVTEPGTYEVRLQAVHAPAPTTWSEWRESPLYARISPRGHAIEGISWTIEIEDSPELQVFDFALDEPTRQRIREESPQR